MGRIEMSEGGKLKLFQKWFKLKYPNDPPNAMAYAVVNGEFEAFCAGMEWERIV